MSRRVRLALFLVSALGLAWLFVAAFLEIPASGKYPGPYGDLVNERTVSLRRVSNAVGAVTFDFRGFDTLGEEFIFFAAVMGVRILLRPGKLETERQPVDHSDWRAPLPGNEGVLAASGFLLPVSLLVVLYVMAHGHLTPGGGFQAGTMLGSFVALLYLAGRYALFRKVASPEALDPVKSLSAAGFVVIGLMGLFMGGVFLLNVLPYGTFSKLASGGTLPLINSMVTLEVGAGVAVLVFEFLNQVLSIRLDEERIR